MPEKLNLMEAVALVRETQARAPAPEAAEADPPAEPVEAALTTLDRNLHRFEVADWLIETVRQSR